MLHDWTKKIALLADWGQRKIRTIKKIGDGEEMVAIKMTQTKFCPDGTEKYPGLRVSLYAGIAYSLPSSVAEILVKEGSAEKVE
jgi:hypothetical protein